MKMGRMVKNGESKLPIVFSFQSWKFDFLQRK